MTTKQFNSKGKLIEELEDTIYTRAPFQSPKPVSPKHYLTPQPLFATSVPSEKKEQNETTLTQPFPKVDLAQPFPKVDLAPPFLTVEKVDEEILAWCEYYLHSKKIERKLDHIYFPSTLSTFRKGGAK